MACSASSPLQLVCNGKDRTGDLQEENPLWRSHGHCFPRFLGFAILMTLYHSLAEIWIRSCINSLFLSSLPSLCYYHIQVKRNRCQICVMSSAVLDPSSLCIFLCPALRQDSKTWFPMDSNWVYTPSVAESIILSWWCETQVTQELGFYLPNSYCQPLSWCSVSVY